MEHERRTTFGTRVPVNEKETWRSSASNMRLNDRRTREREREREREKEVGKKARANKWKKGNKEIATSEKGEASETKRMRASENEIERERSERRIRTKGRKGESRLAGQREREREHERRLGAILAPRGSATRNARMPAGFGVRSLFAIRDTLIASPIGKAGAQRPIFLNAPRLLP